MIAEGERYAAPQVYTVWHWQTAVLSKLSPSFVHQVAELADALSQRSEEEPLRLNDASLDVCSDGQCSLECGGKYSCKYSLFRCPTRGSG